MADYTTVPMVVRSLTGDIFRVDAPPAGAVGWAIPDGLGGFEDVGLGDLSEPAAAGTAGPFLDPYDVPTAKRKEVVDANVPAYLETDTAYYYKEFVDEVYGPGQPAYYKCMPSAPANVGGPMVWKWFRIDIL